MLTSSEMTTPPDEFICPITGKLIRDPVTTNSGRWYERTGIEDWIRINPICPMTRRDLADADGQIRLAPTFQLKSLINKWLAEHPEFNEDTQLRPAMPQLIPSETVIYISQLFASHSTQVRLGEQSDADQTWGRLSEAFRLLIARLTAEEEAETEANILELTLLIVRHQAVSLLTACLQKFPQVLASHTEQLWACALTKNNLAVHKVLLDHGLLMQDKNEYLLSLLALRNTHEYKHDVLDTLLASYRDEDLIPAQAIQTTIDDKDSGTLAKLLQTRRFQAPRNVYTNLLHEYERTYTPLRHQFLALTERFGNHGAFSFYLGLKLVDALASACNILLCLMPLSCMLGGITLLAYDMIPALGWSMTLFGLLLTVLQMAMVCDDDIDDFFDALQTRNVVNTDRANDVRSMQQLKITMTQHTLPLLKLCEPLVQAGVMPTQDERDFAETHQLPENVRHLLHKPASNTMTSKMRYRISSLVDSAFLSIFASSENQADRQHSGAYQIIQQV